MSNNVCDWCEHVDAEHPVNVNNGMSGYICMNFTPSEQCKTAIYGSLNAPERCALPEWHEGECAP